MQDSMNANCSRNFFEQYWPLVLYVSVCFLTSFLLPASVNYLANSLLLPFGALLGTVFYGIFGGAIAFATIVAGFATRNWLLGIFLGSLFLGFAFLCLVIGQEFFPSAIVSIADDTSIFVILTGVLVLPLLLFLSAAPCFLFRLSLGSHLTRDPNPSQKTPLGIEDFLLVMVSIAAMLFLARGPQLFFEVRITDYWQSLAASVALLVMFSYFAVLPPGVLILRSKTFLRSLCWAIAFSLTTLGLSVIALWLMGALSPESIGLTICVIAAISTTYFLGLLALRASGLRLRNINVRFVHNEDSETEVADSSFDELEDESARSVEDAWHRSSRRTRRWTTATLFACAFSAAISFQVLGSFRAQDLKRNLEFTESLQTTGGEVKFNGRNIVEVRFGEPPTREQIRALSSHRRLGILDLSNLEVSDGVLAEIAKLKNLEQLDLSYSTISDANIEALRALHHLLALNIRGTKISKAGLTQLVAGHQQTRTWPNFQVGDLPAFVDDPLELKNILPSHYFTLGLQGYGFTDAQLSDLMKKFPELRELDIQQNQVDGSFLNDVAFGQISNIYLDDNPVTDAGITKALKSINFGGQKRLSLRKSKVSDASLPVLGSTLFFELTLGESQITEKGLANSKISIGRGLRIHDPNVTGECFKTWNPRCQLLDLSECGVTDETVPYVLNVTPQHLILSETQITDASLDGLSKFQGNILNLSDTNITYEGLLNSNLSHIPSLIISPRQFNPTQFHELKQTLNVQFGVRDTW